MTVHLRKLSVGSKTLDDLQDWQDHLLASQKVIYHTTRNWPRRKDELLDGGSIYWIIKGAYRARQKIIGFEEAPIEEAMTTPSPTMKKPYCRIVLAPKLIPVETWPHRLFQGWRYLENADAPPDLALSQKREALPDNLLKDMNDMGLLKK